MTVGERIKARRKELGISADDLALFLGVSRSTIFRYESGYIEKLPADSLEPIAKALSTTVRHLMGWDEVSSEARFPQYSSEEMWVIDCYRNITDNSDREIIRMILKKYSPSKKANAV